MRRRVVLECKPDLICPIQGTVLEDAVTANDGNVYSKVGLEEWIKVSNPLVSPITGKPMTAAHTPCPAKTKAVQDFLHAKNSTPLVDDPKELTKHMLSSDIFRDLDKVSSHNLMRTLNLVTPSIIVIGAESSGKSTLLERLMGFPVLPKDQSFCTCMVVRVHLRRGNFQIPKLCVRRRDNQTVVPNTAAIATFETLHIVMRKTMDDAKTRANCPVVIDEEILVEIQVPYCPNLNIVDLPGLVTVSPVRELTEKLALDVAKAEKASARFLLVVKATEGVHVSAGTQIIQGACIDGQTLGVLTHLDKLNDEQEEYKEQFQRLLNQKVITLKHGWCLTSSLIPRKSAAVATFDGVKEAQRLLRLDQEEDIRLETTYYVKTMGAALQSRIGMKQIRELVREVFEDYLVHDWVPKIHTHLVSVVDQLREKNLEIGLPMPKVTKYEEILVPVREIMKVVYPTFDCSQLDTRAPKEFTELLKERSVAVCTHTTKDWVCLASVAPVWAITNEFNQRIPAQVPILSKTGLYLGLSTAVAVERAWIDQKLNDLTTLLVKQTKEKLPDALVTAMLTPPTAPVAGLLAQVGNSVRNFFTAGSLRKVSDENQSALMRLNRFPNLRGKLREHLVTSFAKQADLFKTHADALRTEAAASCLQTKFVANAAGTTSSARYVPSPDDVQDLPHRVIQLWFEDVVYGVQKTIDEWGIPSDCVEEDAGNAKKRLEVLGNLQTTVDVLKALHDLKANVEKQRAIS